MRDAVVAQDFGSTADARRGGAALDALPSVDLAVVDFAAAGGPRWADVLLSREHPHGHVATIADGAGAVVDVRFDGDVRDAALDSPAWQPGADWSRLAFAPIAPAPQAQTRFVAPYPASLLKLLVGVGVGLAVDRRLLVGWPDAVAPMLVASDNAATDDCVAALHRCGVLTPARDHALNATFAAWGLSTLQVNATTAAGGWRNADGAGVGAIHMTAWDTVRLLWLLDVDAPPPSWLPPTAPTLSRQTRRRLLALLARQRHDHVLSSGSLRGVPGWVAGLPDAPAFAHKTGTTDSYASDAGVVREASGTHYAVAVLTTLGRRTAPDARCATTWRLPALGAAVHRLLAK